MRKQTIPCTEFHIIYIETLFAGGEEYSLLLKYALHTVISFKRYSMKMGGHFIINKPDTYHLTQVGKINTLTTVISHVEGM